MLKHSQGRLELSILPKQITGDQKCKRTCNIFSHQTLIMSYPEPGLKFWNLEAIGRGKPEYQGENLSKKRRESTTNSTRRQRHLRDLNPRQNGRMQVISPIQHPCFLIPIYLKIFRIGDFFSSTRPTKNFAHDGSRQS